LNRLRADLLLLFNAMIWGACFVAQKTANDSVGPISFIALRYLVSALLLAPFALRETRTTSPPRRQDVLLAATIGVILFVSMSFQQIGLLSTTATNAGFLTALYVIGVPFVAWGFTRQRPDLRHLVACFTSAFGAWLLATNGTAQPIGFGDLQILASTLGWSFWIVLVSIYMKRADRPYFLAFAQYALTAAAAAVFGLSLEQTTLDGVLACIGPILFAGVVSGALATTLQAIAQKYTPATDAALIVSLESVFAALAGALVLRESLTSTAIAGCGLILVSVLLVEAPLRRLVPLARTMLGRSARRTP
jgi:drug/metabolite transporter (DMT)-like permease